MAIFQNFGPWEILIVLGILILLFGATRLPKMGRNMGKGLRGFKEGLQEGVTEPQNKALPKGDATADDNLDDGEVVEDAGSGSAGADD